MFGWVDDLIDGIASGVTTSLESVGESVINQVFGWLWDLIFDILETILGFITNLIVNTGDSLRDCRSDVGPGNDWAPTGTCLGQDWFGRAFEASMTLSFTTMTVVLIVAVLAAMWKRESGQGEKSLAQVLLALPKIGLLYMFLVTGTVITISVTDEIAYAWVGVATGESVDNIGEMLAKVVSDQAAGSVVGPPSAAHVMVMGLVILMVVMMLVMVVLLAVRSAAIQILLVLAPFVALGMMTSYATSIRKVLEKLVGLILMKPVMVIVLGLASVMANPPDVGPTIIDMLNTPGGLYEVLVTRVNGLVMLFMATLAPMMVFQFIPELESAGVAGGAPGKAAGKVMQYGYYARMFRPGGGARMPRGIPGAGG